MAERVLTIEMGYSLTKVCEIEKNGKSPKVYNSFVIPTPEGMLRDGLVENNSEFINLFLRNMTVRKIKTRKVIFSITSSKIATREAVVPYVPEKKLGEIVRANLSEYFPVDLSQYLFSHSILSLVKNEASQAQEEDDLLLDDKPKKQKDKNKGANKPSGYKLLLLAAPKQLIQSYELFAKNIGLEIDSIDYNGNSVFQAAKDECKNGVQLIVKVDERSSLLMVLDNGIISLNRTIPYGIDEAISTLQMCREMGEVRNYENALELVRKKSVVLSSFSEGASFGPDTLPFDNERKSITERLRPLVGGIVRVIDFYNANHSQTPVEKIFLTGVGADFVGLNTLLGKEAGLSVQNLTRIAGMDTSKIFKDSTGEYVACVGAAISPLSFYADHTETANKKMNRDVDTGKLAAVTLVLCVIGAIALAAYAILPYMEEVDHKKEYENTIEKLQPAYDDYQAYMLAQSDVEYVKSLESATHNRNDELNAIIDVLEKEMPKSMILNSLTADEYSVQLDISVSTKDEAAYVVNQFKNMEYFNRLGISSIDEVTSPAGEVMYNFLLELEYSPEDEETETETEAEAEEVAE
ncbi:MAG: hypothetical protein K5662_06195 [Lachnospiraceae bacterium]|nr:hypothetical protein [Lachnospiraceae bacterium]